MADEPRFPNVRIVVNPAAGHDEPVLGVLNAALHPAGIRWDVRITNGPREATELARQAVAEGVDLVAVYGGDGTVAEVAEGMAGSGVPLALLPGGTGNGAAGELRIPTTLPAAAALIADPDAVLMPVDLGRVGRRVFLLRCAAGAIATIDERATRELKSDIGGLAYVVGGISALGDLQMSMYHITTDGKLASGVRGATCIVANGGGFGGVGRLAEDVSMSDGLLDVFVYTGENLGELSAAVAALRAAVSTKTLPQPVRFKGRHIVIEADPPQQIVADGEPVGETPLVVEALPAALQVLVPGPAGARK